MKNHLPPRWPSGSCWRCWRSSTWRSSAPPWSPLACPSSLDIGRLTYWGKKDCRNSKINFRIGFTRTFSPGSSLSYKCPWRAPSGEQWIIDPVSGEQWSYNYLVGDKFLLKYLLSNENSHKYLLSNEHLHKYLVSNDHFHKYLVSKEYLHKY